MLKRFLLSAAIAAALTGSAGAVTALPAAAGGQSFYVSTSLSDTVGCAAAPTIYNIENRTYFKIRDLGRLLDFGVAYDAASNTVHIDPSAHYTPAPGESGAAQNTASSPVPAQPTRQRLLLAGKPIAPQVYNIQGNNYIGLRTLGALVDFGVSYNYDNRRITVYAAYPYAAETTWNAAMNDFSNDLRTLSPAAYPRAAARYAPVITASHRADWRALVSTLRAVKDAPPYASGRALHRSNLYWADALTAALTGTAPAATPRYAPALDALAAPALFGNPDEAALRADFNALSTAYLGAQPASFAHAPVTNGYAKNARARPALAEHWTMTAGADAAARAAAQAYFSKDTAALSALSTDDARLAYIDALLRRECRTGGTASWTTAYGRRAAVSPLSLAAAADRLFAEAGIPAFLAQSWSAAWSIVYINGQWAVFNFSTGGALHSLGEYRLPPPPAQPFC